MKTQVEFRSDKFPPSEADNEAPNPELFGARLAEYLREKLKAEGIATGEIFPEDWGWVVEVQNEAFALWVGCGHQNGDDNQFLCFIEPSKPEIRKFFKKIDTTPQINRLSAALEKILEADPDIREVAWSER